MSFWLKGNLFALVLAYLLRLVSWLVRLARRVLLPASQTYAQQVSDGLHKAT